MRADHSACPTVLAASSIAPEIDLQIDLESGGSSSETPAQKLEYENHANLITFCMLFLTMGCKTKKSSLRAPNRMSGSRHGRGAAADTIQVARERAEREQIWLPANETRSIGWQSSFALEGERPTLSTAATVEAPPDRPLTPTRHQCRWRNEPTTPGGLNKPSR